MIKKLFLAFLVGVWNFVPAEPITVFLVTIGALAVMTAADYYTNNN